MGEPTDRDTLEVRVADVERRLVRLEGREAGEEPVDHTARNGVITAAGIFLGFLLTFLASWAFTYSFLGVKEGGPPLPWRWVDTVVISFLFLGIVAITWALCGVVMPYQLKLRNYQSKVRLFVIGIVLALVGVALSIVGTLPAFRK
jgi:hypothetical protein